MSSTCTRWRQVQPILVLSHAYWIQKGFVGACSSSVLCRYGSGRPCTCPSPGVLHRSGQTHWTCQTLQAHQVLQKACVLCQWPPGVPRPQFQE